MKHIAGFIFVLLLHVNVSAQDSDTASSSGKMTFYLSAGVKGYVYNSNGFYNQQMDMFKLDSSYLTNKYTSISSGSNLPVMYRKSFVAGPGISAGIEHTFNSKGDWRFYMQAEFGYNLSFEQVNGADSYVLEQPMVGFTSWEANITDTVNAKIIQHIVSLRYNVLVGYKNAFLSFGLLPGLYIDQVNANRIEHADGYKWEEAARYQLNDNYNKDTTFTGIYTILSIEAGLGYRFQLKRFEIKPAVFLDYSFVGYAYLRSYASLQLVYKLD